MMAIDEVTEEQTIGQTMSEEEEGTTEARTPYEPCAPYTHVTLGELWKRLCAVDEALDGKPLPYGALDLPREVIEQLSETANMCEWIWYLNVFAGQVLGKGVSWQVHGAILRRLLDGTPIPE